MGKYYLDILLIYNLNIIYMFDKTSEKGRTNSLNNVKGPVGPQSIVGY